MTEPLILTHTKADGVLYEAEFLPSHGMTLSSYKRNGVEVIDQGTKKSFEQRSAGLGCLIGPHFHRRKIIPNLEGVEFPQSAYCRDHGIEDIFSHGVGRYVPWKWEINEGKIKAEISGKDLWCGVPLSAIEGQNFQMEMQVGLNEEGLKIALSVVSDSDSIVGFHYYYRLCEGNNLIVAEVKDQMIESGEMKKIPQDFGFDGTFLKFPATRAIDHTFFPAKDPLKGHISLENSEFVLSIEYKCVCQENSFQLYRPEGARFICIEPLSSQDPRHPNLSVSGIEITLQIEPAV